MEKEFFPKKKGRFSTVLFVLGAACLLVAGWEFATGLPPPGKKMRRHRVGPDEPYVFLYVGLAIVAGGCFCRGMEKDPPA